VLGLLAHGRAVFTVQRDIEHAGTELGHHLGLQLQAFAHALFHAAVMVAHRQQCGCGLGAEQNVSGVGSGNRHESLVCINKCACLRAHRAYGA